MHVGVYARGSETGGVKPFRPVAVAGYHSDLIRIIKSKMSIDKDEDIGNSLGERKFAG